MVIPFTGFTQKGYEVGGWLGTSVYHGDLNPEIKLQQTNSNEIFFEFDNHTYEGKELSEFIKKNKIKVE